MPATCTIVDGESPTCYCPLSGLIAVLGGKYAMQLICIIGAHDRLRFGDIEAHLPVASTSTLSTRLKELEEAGVVARHQFDEIPPRVEYTLTEEGAALCDRLEPLLAWVADR